MSVEMEEDAFHPPKAVFSPVSFFPQCAIFSPTLTYCLRCLLILLSHFTDPRIYPQKPKRSQPIGSVTAGRAFFHCLPRAPKLSRGYFSTMLPVQGKKFLKDTFFLFLLAVDPHDPVPPPTPTLRSRLFAALSSSMHRPCIMRSAPSSACLFIFFLWGVCSFLTSSHRPFCYSVHHPFSFSAPRAPSSVLPSSRLSSFWDLSCRFRHWFVVNPA